MRSELKQFDSNTLATTVKFTDPVVYHRAGLRSEQNGNLDRLRQQYPTPIADDWAIGFDDRQWLLLKGGLRSKKRGGGRMWQPVSYIASTKDILRRCTHEKGCTLNPAGEAFINALPNTFQDFIAGRADV